MTGNLLLLAIEAYEWMVDDMLFTLSLIAAYIIAGAMYDIINLRVRNKNVVVLGVAMGGVLAMGILADVLRYVLRSCTDNDPSNCRGNSLYFLTPLAFMTGIVANGYCNSHSDGFTSTLMTGHMRVCPNSLLRLYLSPVETKLDETDRILLIEKARLSVVMIAMFFAGALAGDVVDDLSRERIAQGYFSSVFTIFSVFMVGLCISHSKLCDHYIRNHEEMVKALTTIERRTAVLEASIGGMNGASVGMNIASAILEIDDAFSSDSWSDNEIIEG